MSTIAHAQKRDYLARMQAFPTPAHSDPNGNHTFPETGMTLCQHFASLAMQGLLSSHDKKWIEHEKLAKIAVSSADALIEELVE